MENQFDFLIREMASEQMFKFYEYLDVDTIRVFLDSTRGIENNTETNYEVRNNKVFSGENVIASYYDGIFYRVRKVDGKLSPHLLNYMEDVCVIVLDEHFSETSYKILLKKDLSKSTLEVTDMNNLQELYDRFGPLNVYCADMRLEEVNISTVICDMLWLKYDNIVGVNTCIALISVYMKNIAVHFPCIQISNIDCDDLLYRLAYVGIELTIVDINTEHPLYVDGMESLCDIDEIVSLVKSTIRRFSANKK